MSSGSAWTFCSSTNSSWVPPGPWVETWLSWMVVEMGGGATNGPGSVAAWAGFVTSTLRPRATTENATVVAIRRSARDTCFSLRWVGIARGLSDSSRDTCDSCQTRESPVRGRFLATRHHFNKLGQQFNFESRLFSERLRPAGFRVGRSQQPDRAGCLRGPVELDARHVERDGQPLPPVRAGYPAATFPAGDLVARDGRVARHVRQPVRQCRLCHPPAPADTFDQGADLLVG